MVLLAGEVALPLHGAVVLALGLVQDDSHPLPGGKEGVSDVGHRAALALADHLHQGADLDRPAAPVGAHPAAAAAGALGGGGEAQVSTQISGRNPPFLPSLLNTRQQMFYKLVLMSSVILANQTAEANVER